MLKKIKKATSMLLTLVLTFLMSLLVVGCSKPSVNVATPTIDHPPYCKEFLEVAGKPFEEVLTHIGLTVDDFTLDNGDYVYQQPITYEGLTFQMKLHPFKDVVSSIYYVLYEDSFADGAKAAIGLRDTLLNGYGSPYRIPKYSAGNYGQDETWPLSDFATMDVATLEEKLSAEEDFITGDVGYGGSLTWLLSVDLSHLSEEELGMWPSQTPSCITATLNVTAPIEDNPAGIVYIGLKYGLSYEYRP